MSAQGGDVLEDAERLISSLESHPDPAVGEQVRALLEQIDIVHRAALTHLVTAIQGMAGEAFMNRLTADPAIRLLLMSYELLAVDRRLLAEEALDSVRGHLHAHGVDVELTDVVGGAVYVKLHGMEHGGISLDGVRRDLEAALKEGLLGFQELVIGDRRAPAALIQVEGLRRAQRPVYRRALATTDLAPGQMRGVEVDGQSILLANVDGEYYAVANRCGESPLPLEFGTLRGAEVVCSWHGCRYDARTGTRLDSPEGGAGADDRMGGRLTVFPVSVEDGEIRVAMGVEPASTTGVGAE